MKPVEKVLEAVDRYEKRHNGFWCICPAHDDHNPSLHVQQGDDGRALIICRAGCDQQRVMTALEARGLKSADLFPNDPRASTRAKTTRSTHKGREQLAKSYDIKDVSGVLHGIHERWENPETPDQKSFKWKLPNGKYSKGDINPAAMPLYNSELVPSWPEGCRIVLVEGETPAEALWKYGIKAVGTVCGATSTPDRDVLEVLSGHEVIAWADNDAAGLAHMRRCVERLEGIASAVRWFEWAEAPHKGTPRTIQP
jgi:putative DNA primase/helicase